MVRFQRDEYTHSIDKRSISCTRGTRFYPSSFTCNSTNSRNDYYINFRDDIAIFGSQVLQFIESYTGFESLFASVISSLRWVIGFALLIVFLMILYLFASSMMLPFKYF